MMLSLRAPFGSTISLDLREKFGDRVELDCFQFVIPPVEFRLIRLGRPLQDGKRGTVTCMTCSMGRESANGHVTVIGSSTTWIVGAMS
jgi:hypothetical protein